jgi:hypothetical protein
MSIRPLVFAALYTIACAALMDMPAGAQTAAPAGGSVTGTIKFQGTPPRPQRVRMTSDPLCVPDAKGATSETLMVAKDGGIQNVFVYVKDGLGGRTFPPPKTPVTIDQKGCRYIPHVFGVQAGQPVIIKNSDPAVHNVNATAKVNREFNLIQPKGAKPSTRTFDKPEIMVPLRCDVHPWMASWGGVVSHPFFAVSAENGTFEIKGLPAGTYTIEAWHEQLGTQTQKVTVAANKGASASFTYKK